MNDVQAINLDGIAEGLRPAVGQLLQELANTLKPGGKLAGFATTLGSLHFVGRFKPSLASDALGPVLKRFARQHGAELSHHLVQQIVSRVLEAVNPGRQVG